MGGTLTAERTFDAALVRRIKLRSDIFEETAEEGLTLADAARSIRPHENVYLRVDAGDELVGLFTFQAMNAVTVQVHILILPEHRKQYSMTGSTVALEWLYLRLGECRKLAAWIPECFPHVLKHAKKFGFRVEGTLRESYQRDGKLWDQWLLGVSKADLRTVLDGRPD